MVLIDDMQRDSNLAGQFCNRCSIKFGTHANLMRQQTYAAGLLSFHPVAAACCCPVGVCSFSDELVNAAPIDASELSPRLSVDIYTSLVWFGYRHLLLQLSCPCRQVQLCNPILSYPILERSCRGIFSYINQGRGDTLAQKCRESLPPRSCIVKSARGDLEGYWKHPAPGPGSENGREVCEQVLWHVGGPSSTSCQGWGAARSLLI
eukprot:1160488-Pelagomonas_calceolata.AAC.9